MTAPLELVAGGLHFPTSLAFDFEGRLWVGESGLSFAGAPPGGRVLRVDPSGSTVVASGLRAPLNGLLWRDGAFIVSEGGRPGRISRVDLDGRHEVLLDGLPGFGNYQTNMAVSGPDGKLYFSQGAMTNLGVIGHDSFDIGWLGELHHDVDIPGYDVIVSGATFETPDPRDPGKRASTGVFCPFGTPGSERRIAGRVPCTAAVLRCDPDGSSLELVAWGLRNAYGLLFLPDGRLLATDQGADERGSRPIGNAPDLLFEVRSGLWYGFPDYVGTTPVTDPRFRSQDGPALEPVLLNHGELPKLAAPLLQFPVNAAATKLCLVPADAPRFAGQLLVCFFGDERPVTGPPGPKVGRCLARVDLERRAFHPVEIGPFRRPIDVCIHDGYVYVLDFGEFELSPGRIDARAGSGAVHRFPLSAL